MKFVTLLSNLGVDNLKDLFNPLLISYSWDKRTPWSRVSPSQQTSTSAACLAIQDTLRYPLRTGLSVLT